MLPRRLRVSLFDRAESCVIETTSVEMVRDYAHESVGVARKWSGMVGKSERLFSDLHCSPPIEHRRQMLPELCHPDLKLGEQGCFKPRSAIPIRISLIKLPMMAHQVPNLVLH